MENRHIDVLIRQHKAMIKRLESMKTNIKTNDIKNIYKYQEIIEAVNKEFEVDCTQMTNVRQYCEARYAAMYLMRNHTNLTARTIAALLNRGDHSTVISGTHRFHELREVDSQYKERTDKLIDMFV